jgi:hypothetical protein
VTDELSCRAKRGGTRMLQRPHGSLSASVGETARLLAAEAGGPQFIHAFDSPSKLKSADAGHGLGGGGSVRSGLLALLNRRLEAWCKRLGPTAAVWLTAAAICAVYLLFERPPTDGFGIDSNGERMANTAGMAVGRDNAAFTNLGDGLPQAQASFVQQSEHAQPIVAQEPIAGVQKPPRGEVSALSYLPDLSSYLPDLTVVYQNYTTAALDPVAGTPSTAQP